MPGDSQRSDRELTGELQWGDREMTGVTGADKGDPWYKGVRPDFCGDSELRKEDTFDMLIKGRDTTLLSLM